MSDMQQSPMGQSPMAQARSPFNPTDAAYMKSKGQMSENMTFGQYMENAFGIKWDDPLQSAAQKMKSKVQTASPVGKVQAMAGGQPPAGGQPQAAPQQPPSPGGLDALMRR